MGYRSEYAADEPARADVDARAGTTLLEFGAPWCGHCIAAQPLIAAAIDAGEEVQHVKIEDGRGRPLGRSYRVKLWPTLVVLRDGEERARVVRPHSAGEIAAALAQAR